MRWKLRLRITRSHWLIAGFATIATLNYRWGGYEVAVWAILVFLIPWLRNTLSRSWTIQLSRTPWISVRRDHDIPPVQLPKWAPEDDDDSGDYQVMVNEDPPDDFDGEMTPSQIRRLR